LRARLTAALLALCALVATAAPAAAQARFETSVFALVPRPGFPARAYVSPNNRVYEGTYDNPTGDSVPSRVLEYSADGTLQRSWTIAGQNLAAAHGIQVATSDARGRLMLLDKDPARALLLDPKTGAQSTYATFPDLPPCSGGASPCSPAGTDQPAVPNYAAWGPDGALYVTDYLQAVVWRVPPGGGQAQVWLADSRLDGNMFGTTGIVLSRDRSEFLIAQQSSAGGAAGNPATGRIYEVPIAANGKPGAVRQLWESAPVDGPDGFAIARSGNLYVALTAANQIAIVSPQGQEVGRIGQAGTGANGSPVPFDSPSSAMFLGSRLIVANQSYFTGTAANQAILDVAAGEPGAPEFVPGAKKKHKRHKRRHHKHHRHRHHRGGRREAG